MLSTLQLLLGTLLLVAAAAAPAQNSGVDVSGTGQNANVNSGGLGGPTRLRQEPSDTASPARANGGVGTRGDQGALRRDGQGAEVPRPTPSEFELYVNRLAFASDSALPGAAQSIRRLGSGLITEQNLGGEAIDYSPLVPPDYLVASGDEIVLSVWGSVDAELRLFVDRSGRISIPRVGTIMVSGVRYADLPAVISARMAQTFKNFQLSVSLGQLRGVRVYVTGFVLRPGAYTVNALSSVANAVVRAGGPSDSGSFRDIQLRRGNAVVSTLDFYDLLLKGDRSSDRLVQADDVIHVGPIGQQVAVIGSVNRPAIFELKRGENIVDVLRMAGGFAPVADTTRMALERVSDHATVRVIQVDMAQAANTETRNGDVLRAFNAVAVATSMQGQNKRVRIEGEVMRPGDYVLPAASSIADALRLAGGLTPGAFVFGTAFTRESVRLSQQENYERALRSLENEIALSTSTQRITNAEEAAAQTGRVASSTRLLERLRTVRPTGRVVLEVPPNSRELPNLMLEDGDRIFVPPVPSSVGVFGSVFNAGNFLREEGLNLSDYLRMAGGPTRGAAPGGSFVVRANGTVVSNQQADGWGWGLRASFEQIPALPGDTLFVPEELDKTTFLQYAKDWTQVLWQFALGAAAFVTLTD